MRRRMAIFAVGFAALAAGCTSASGTPATTPPTSAPPPTTTVNTTAPTTTMTLGSVTTTTMDRISEIQAIYQDLEDRRVAALWEGDAETFISLFVDTPYRDESVKALDLIEPGDPPVLNVVILEVLKDEPDCLVFVATTTIDTSTGLADEHTTTLQPVGDGWGYAYVSGDPGGWLCTEPHPLDG